jgi:hypothetical protein
MVQRPTRKIFKPASRMTKRSLTLCTWTQSCFCNFCIVKHCLSISFHRGISCASFLIHRTYVSFTVEIFINSGVFTTVDVTPCSPVEVHRNFGGTYFHLQGRASTQFVACLLPSACLIYVRPWRWRQYVLSKSSWTSTGLHNIHRRKLCPSL